MSAIQPDSWSPTSSIILNTVTLILTFVTTVYYWFVIPRPIAGSRNAAATFKNDVGAGFIGIWWIRSFTVLCSFSGIALVFATGFKAEAVTVPLSYCVAVLHFLTEFEFIPSFSTNLNEEVRHVLQTVLWVERLISLVELSTIIFIWCFQPGSRQHAPIVLLAVSAFKYAVLACIHTAIHLLHKCDKAIEIRGVQLDWRFGIRLYLLYVTITIILLAFGLCTDRLDLSTYFFLLLASSHLSYACLVENLLDTITVRQLKRWTPDLEMQTNVGQPKGPISENRYVVELPEGPFYIYLCSRCDKTFTAPGARDHHFWSRVCQSVFDELD